MSNLYPSIGILSFFIPIPLILQQTIIIVYIDFLHKNKRMRQKYSSYRKSELYFVQKNAPEIYFAHLGR
ncbi:hypothetical protein CVR97_28445 [Salmonella enterica subsp. enterica serovar Typhimurium]|nr:hypothetical protein CVR97_28445 [Salmonella enterica subsp. enterica serovar Typhimurium]